MNKQVIAYWAVTGLFCLAMTASGTGNLVGAEPMRESMMDLGYPEYLMKILGVAKLLGVYALLSPGLPWLKEWAYAGFTFDLMGASASHWLAGHSIGLAIVPLVVLAIAGASYLLRPASRKIIVTTSPNIDSTHEAVQ